MYRYWIAAALVIFSANGALATGWQRQTYGTASAYCYPAYVYSYPATYIYPAVMPLASMPLASMPLASMPLASSPLAVPTPAPPSPHTVEPPLNRKAFMPAADKAMVTPGAVSDRCRVGFWNQSGRELKLVVAGQLHLVPHDRAVTLDVPRTFVWQIDQQPARTETIAAERTTHDIVLR